MNRANSCVTKCIQHANQFEWLSIDANPFKNSLMFMLSLLVSGSVLECYMVLEPHSGTKVTEQFVELFDDNTFLFEN